jgi:hypothetical protein
MSYCSQLQFCLPPVPPSTRIMGEFLHLFSKLDEIHSDLNAVENGEEKAVNRIQDLPEKMDRISNIFNDNIKYMYEQIMESDSYKFHDFETYSKRYSSIIADQNKQMLEEEYVYKSSLAGYKYYKEKLQLVRLGAFSSQLCLKIEGVMNRITALNLSHPQVPKLNAIDLDSYTATLLTKALDSYTATLLTKGCVKVKQTDEPLPSPSIDVSVALDVGTGNALGVCHEPLWAEKPIAFTSNEGKWTGQVPVGKEWKFVILQNGQPSKWEDVTPNRRYEEANTSVSFNSEDVKFTT